MPSNTRIKPTLVFIKNGTQLLIRLKVPFSSSLFLAIRVKKLQMTFSSRLTSFSTNSNKVWIDFTHNLTHSAPCLLSKKQTNKQTKIVISGKPSLFLLHNIFFFIVFFFFFFLQHPVIFFKKINHIFM